MASYSDWEKGYQLQLLVPNLEEAKRVTEQILDIQEHSPQWEYLEFKGNANEVERYEELPDKVQVAGKLVRPVPQRATATVKFYKALIKFPHLPRYYPLCDNKKVLLTDLKFLEE